MREYLKNAKWDKLYNNGMVILISILVITAIFFIGLGIDSQEYLFSLFIVGIFFVVLIPIWLIDKQRKNKIAGREKYYVISLAKKVTYGDILKVFDNIDKNVVRYNYSDNANIFSFKKKINYRVLTLYQDEFDLDNYKKTRKNTNHGYDQKYHISHNISLEKANKMFDVNIICLDYENSQLYTYMSIDAEANLRRVVSMYDVAIVGNKLIIPSIRDNCNPPGINYYLKVNKVLFKLFDATYN